MNHNSTNMYNNNNIHAKTAKEVKTYNNVDNYNYQGVFDDDDLFNYEPQQYRNSLPQPLAQQQQKGAKRVKKGKARPLSRDRLNNNQHHTRRGSHGKHTKNHQPKQETNYNYEVMNDNNNGGKTKRKKKGKQQRQQGA